MLATAAAAIALMLASWFTVHALFGRDGERAITLAEDGTAARVAAPPAGDEPIAVLVPDVNRQAAVLSFHPASETLTVRMAGLPQAEDAEYVLWASFAHGETRRLGPVRERAELPVAGIDWRVARFLITRERAGASPGRRGPVILSGRFDAPSE
jgi:hypothetical protein